MFELCRAFIVATAPADNQALELTAKNLGFGEIVSSIGGAGGPARANLTYFFVDHRVDQQSMADVIETIREDRDDQLCYSPIVLFTDDGSRANVAKYLRFGFDDVIELPASRDALASRLGEQMRSEQRYFKTNDYFGPDRRRKDRTGLRAATAAYTQVLFERDPSHGIHIVSREERGHRFRPQLPLLAQTMFGAR